MIYGRHFVQLLVISGVDPNTLNLDPDPGVYYQLKKKKFKISLAKNYYLKTSLFFKTRRSNCHPMKLLISWVFELLIYILNLLPPFYPIFACVDTDPYSEYRSGSRKLLNRDQIRIRIHNTASYIYFILLYIVQWQINDYYYYYYCKRIFKFSIYHFHNNVKNISCSQSHKQ